MKQWAKSLASCIHCLSGGVTLVNSNAGMKHRTGLLIDVKTEMEENVSVLFMYAVF